ncbi:T9SS type A sorting domain-containing protein [Hymenobacter norwichensis]|uniref:T9SS type A sorting domain-containing protein n=1 Tax=Hymenobacter norwichensis TaxID=223903 RepID=UPI0003B6D9AC|nr:T9SS type A sorting domain-containing protein [Hymenobacter norwichensis]
MKHLYQFLLLSFCLSWLPAQAQNWRPFRPNGDVHAFRGASPDTIFTLRLDSAGVTGSDSVYYFNRIMRRAGNVSWQKARNNQFGQQLRYNAARRTYALFWNGGSNNTLLLDYLLVLKPFAQLGETWTSGFTDYGVATTLVSRGTMLLDGVQDSVATFRAGATPGVLVVLSKNNGLVSGPANLLFGVLAPKMLTLARRPVPAGLSYYNPLTMLDLQPGDELGYEQTPYTASPFACFTGYTLYRIITRQITADSIAYTMQAQGRTVNTGAPSCGPAGVTVSGVSVARIAASRRTGEWRGSWAFKPLGALLTYAYRSPGITTNANSVFMGLPIVPARYGTTCSGPAALLSEALYSSLPSTGYNPGIDALGWQQAVAQAVGVVQQGEHHLVYSRRTINGTVQTCGSRVNFATLLPTKATQRAAMFQLYPNPTASSVMLTLPAPARAGTTVWVLDALGRTMARQPLTSGQTTAVLLLPGLAAGVYVVEVQTAGEAPQRLRLQYQ